ncbi:MAG: hypothetical protein ACQEP6_02870 [Patescibacteria group bacterium]
MTDSKNNHLALGEKNWWIGIILLIFLVILFSKEFLNGGVKEIIADPLYLFSIIMVGLVLAAPIVWIFSQGKTLISERSLEESDKDEEIFTSLLSLSDNFRVFQSITIDDQSFEILVIGEKTLTVISTLRNNELSSPKTIENIINRTRKKVLFLESFFNKEVPVDFLMIRGGETPNDAFNDLKPSDKKRIIGVSGIRKELEKQNNKNIPPISNKITEIIENHWKEGRKDYSPNDLK